MFAEYLDKHDIESQLLSNPERIPFPTCKNRRRWNALDETIKKEICRWGDEASTGYPMLTATQFLAYVRTGDRKRYETPYFARRKLLMGAVLAECVEDEGKYLDAVIDGLWCICEETSWVISAHNGSSHEGVRPIEERPLPDKRNPYIDLFAAQTAAEMAYTLFLLEEKLNEATPLISRRIRQEIEERIFFPFMTHDDFWWMGMIRKDINNWTPWILSNIIDAALIIITDSLRLKEVLARAMHMLDSYLEVIPDDGGCDEGVAYWNMSGASLLDCLESLYIATDGMIDFYKNDKIKKIGAFPVHAHIHGEYFWNFADCDLKPLLDGERLYRFGVRTGQELLMMLGFDIARKNQSIIPADTPQMNRVLQKLFMPMETQKKRNVASKGMVVLPDLQVGAWRKNGYYATIKGGNNAENHNHNDVGSFIVFLNNEPYVIDAGNLQYTGKTFSHERYSIWNTRCAYHNLPVFSGTEQQAGGHFAAHNLYWFENGCEMSLEKAYPKVAELRYFTRKLMVNNGVTIIDSIVLDKPKQICWHFMVTRQPKIRDGQIVFGNMKLHCESYFGVTFEEIELTDERMKKTTAKIFGV